MTIERRNCPVCRSQSGFTLVELMITMVIFVLAITAASQIFVGLLTQFKQQSKVAETNIEGVIGLELLRTDVEQAGFGLPWDMNGVTYLEADHDLILTPWDDTVYNDAPGNPPRALVIGTSVGLNNSDLLIVKATNVATNNAAHRWTYITDNNGAFTIQQVNSSQEDLLNTDYVIGVMPTASGGRKRVLVSGGAGEANGGVQFAGTPPGTTAGLQPVANTLLSNLVYGISSTGPLRMPFNRADYYIRTPAAGIMPTRCAPGTGVLYKSIVNHSDGMHTEIPIMDCVADMKVVVGLDTNADNLVDTYNIPAGYNAQQVREQVKDVRVYIVAHEGQLDTSYSYKNQVRPPAVPAACDFDDVVCIMDTGLGFVKAVDLSTLPGIGTKWNNYRWKLYKLVASPYSMR